MPIDVGVFDHMDSGNFPAHELYDNRLKLIEAYDAAGFYGYHVAEHHQTTLGMAPSPGIFLAAAAARTTKIKLGALVYILPAYSPLRLIEEICMLDHLTHGRYQFGIGQGVSAFEVAFHGVPFLEAQDMYREAYEVILKGFESDVLNHKGEYYRYVNTPMMIKPYQNPHPPVWYGAAHPAGARWPGETGINIVMNAPRALAGNIIAEFNDAWSKSHDASATPPKRGLVRHVFVGETDEEAIALARGPYRTWKLSHVELWRKFHAENILWPEQLEGALEADGAIVGSVETVRDQINDAMKVSGCDYLVGRFAFGDMSYEDTKHSLDLFVEKVMPSLN
ncbi:MAG: LLM class flavin-dependent oxidoreductase [Rhodospirillaceae bacterium]|nr:LLM class flavin-dependent oxidoreductase [Rhodospirillaceae bacterium]MBT3883142.1 LLM class flavin-dependent oxidoreductase [Rhodospirillaceae bacterium]MBT4719859.1 LLM class flavin-dependent oxidoreductase [Rhodospirillaceae bacterium]MBT5181192.1 LLM class flavin-dependent oxidoreductase [Rhodospirillaceae bacterium]